MKLHHGQRLASISRHLSRWSTQLNISLLFQNPIRVCENVLSSCLTSSSKCIWRVVFQYLYMPLKNGSLWRRRESLHIGDHLSQKISILINAICGHENLQTCLLKNWSFYDWNHAADWKINLLTWLNEHRYVFVCGYITCPNYLLKKLTFVYTGWQQSRHFMLIASIGRKFREFRIHWKSSSEKWKLTFISKTFKQILIAISVSSFLSRCWFFSLIFLKNVFLWINGRVVYFSSQL